MSTPKNKILFSKINFNNIDSREQQKSVKQRFDLNRSGANSVPEHPGYGVDGGGKSGNTGRIGNIDILEIFKKSDGDDNHDYGDYNNYNNYNNNNDRDYSEYNEFNNNHDDEPVDFTNLQYHDEESHDDSGDSGSPEGDGGHNDGVGISVGVEDKIENLQSYMRRIENQLERLENKINKLESDAPHGMRDSHDVRDFHDANKTVPPGSFGSYFFKNTMEAVVIEEVATTLKHTQHICKCGKCFYDICAIALNNVSSHYVTTEQGELLQKANALLNIENLSRISTEIFKAIEIVRNHPSH